MCCPSAAVLDEAHTVKNAAVAHTKASIALQADRRWMCTGALAGWLPPPLAGLPSPRAARSVQCISARTSP